jgi:hypothetical protein
MGVGVSGYGTMFVFNEYMGDVATTRHTLPEPTHDLFCFLFEKEEQQLTEC